MYMIDDEFQWFKDGPDSGEVESNRGELTSWEEN
jgi:hypothetical protein